MSILHQMYINIYVYIIHEKEYIYTYTYILKYVYIYKQDYRGFRKHTYKYSLNISSNYEFNNSS